MDFRSFGTSGVANRAVQGVRATRLAGSGAGHDQLVNVRFRECLIDLPIATLGRLLTLEHGLAEPRFQVQRRACLWRLSSRSPTAGCLSSGSDCNRRTLRTHLARKPAKAKPPSRNSRGWPGCSRPPATVLRLAAAAAPPMTRPPLSDKASCSRSCVTCATVPPCW